MGHYLIEDIISMIAKSPLQARRCHVSTGILIRRLNQNALFFMGVVQML